MDDTARRGNGGRIEFGRLAPLGAALIVALYAGSRIGLLERHGLWADEFVSLAQATGHSLEHPAAAADPAYGDYREFPEPVPPPVYADLLRPKENGTPISDILRAGLMTDCSPPLYYILLRFWMDAFGAGDVALRAFSVLWSLAALALAAAVLRQLREPSALVPALILFTLSPPWLYYSTEGRMYSMTACLALALLSIQLRLWRGGFSWTAAGLWTAAGAAGLLTHYFFAFAWAAAAAWALLVPGRCKRTAWAGAAVLTLIAVWPWYQHIPHTLSLWRVTDYWLLRETYPEFNLAWGIVKLPWTYFSIRNWGWGIRPWIDFAAFLSAAAAISVIAVHKPKGLFSKPMALLWCMAAGPLLGLLVFDLWRGTYTMAVPRYAIAGFPPALMLLSIGLGRLTGARKWLAVLLVAAPFSLGVVKISKNEARNGQPYRETGQWLAAECGPRDVVIVHSIPSGVCGLARYMLMADPAAEAVGFASWVGQLGNRSVPESVQRLTEGRERLYLVIVHTVWDPADEVDWLTENAEVAEQWVWHGVKAIVFAPKNGEVFRWNGAADGAGQPASSP